MAVNSSRDIDPTGIAESWKDAEHYIAGQEEKESVSVLQRLFEKAQSSRQPYEYRWEVNRQYAKGEQITARRRVDGEIVRLIIDRDSQRNFYSIDNIIHPTAQALIGKFTRIIPTARVIPASYDSSDARAADVASEFLDYKMREQKLRVKYIQMIRSMVTFGTAVVECCWNPEAGKELSWCEQCGYQGGVEELGNCPQCMALYAEQIPLKLINEGDVVVQKHDTRDWFPEPGVLAIEDMRYCFLRKAIPISDLRKHYPEKGKYVAAEQGLYVDRSIAISGTSIVNNSYTTQYLDEHVYLYRYFEAPSETYKNGRIVSFANGIILEQTPNYYYKLLGRMPFFDFNLFDREGEYWGESFIDQCHSIQRERNGLLSELRAARSLTNRPKMLVANNSHIGVDQIDTTPGQILYYKSAFPPPKYLTPPEMPQYVYAELNRMEAAIWSKAMVTPQDLGITKGDPSGRFAAIQEAQASESIGHIMAQVIDEWMEMHRAILLIAQKYYSPDRIWASTGSERPRTYSWGEINLADGWDIIMTEDDSLSKNPALRIQQANEMWDRGLFTNPATGMPDKHSYFRMTGVKMPGTNPSAEDAMHLYASQIPDVVLQNILDPQNNPPFQPRWWDDAAICRDELISWLRAAGRNAHPAQVEMVSQIAWLYASNSVYTAMDQNMLPMTGVPQQQQGVKQNTVGMGSGAASNTLVKPAQSQQQEAAEHVQNADASGEQIARMSERHES